MLMNQSLLQWIQRYKPNIPWAITRWATEGTTNGLSRLLQGRRNNIRRKVKVSSQELNPFIGQKPIVVHPSERLPNVLLGLETLHELDHLQVGH